MHMIRKGQDKRAVIGDETRAQLINKWFGLAMSSAVLALKSMASHIFAPESFLRHHDYWDENGISLGQKLCFR